MHFFSHAAQSHFESHNTNNYNLSINGRLCCQPASFPHMTKWHRYWNWSVSFLFSPQCGINHISSWIMDERNRLRWKNSFWVDFEYKIKSKQYKWRRLHSLNIYSLESYNFVPSARNIFIAVWRRGFVWLCLWSMCEPFFITCIPALITHKMWLCLHPRQTQSD